MNVRIFALGRLALSVLALLSGPISLAADSIQVGDVQIDSPTICCLGFSVPIVTGDDDYDAVATIEYRRTGEVDWSTGLPLLRVRPELTSGESPPSQYGLPFPSEQFAGSVFRLDPGVEYEIRIAVTDPDGGDRMQVVTATTQDVPRANPAVPRNVAVSNTSELNNAISVAQPGDVIELSPGTYAGPITISNSGTPSNPIVVRGESAGSVTIDAAGTNYGVTIWGSYVYFERVTVVGSTWGARAYNAEGVVIRESRFTDVDRGIYAKSGTNRNFYICDNVLQDRNAWPGYQFRRSGTTKGLRLAGKGIQFATTQFQGSAMHWALRMKPTFRI